MQVRSQTTLGQGAHSWSKVQYQPDQGARRMTRRSEAGWGVGWSAVQCSAVSGEQLSSEQTDIQKGEVKKIARNGFAAAGTGDDQAS